MKIRMLKAGEKRGMSKKAVSAVIGYIILISIAIVMGGVIYAWLKTYVPKEPLECDDGVSMFVKEHVCSGAKLNLTLKNSGRFSIGGYYIKASKDAARDVATIDLGTILKEDDRNAKHGNAVRFESDLGEQNAFKPGEEITSVFEFPIGASGSASYIGTPNEVVFIEILPIQFITYENKDRITNCQKAAIKYVIEGGNCG